MSLEAPFGCPRQQTKCKAWQADETVTLGHSATSWRVWEP